MQILKKRTKKKEALDNYEKIKEGSPRLEFYLNQ